MASTSALRRLAATRTTLSTTLLRSLSAASPTTNHTRPFSTTTAPISQVNAPEYGAMSRVKKLTTTVLPNLTVFYHINQGVEEIMADYVHHDMTRSLMLVYLRLFFIIEMKDVFLALI